MAPRKTATAKPTAAKTKARARTRKRAAGLDELPAQADPTAALDGAQLLAAARPLLDRLRSDLAERAGDPGVDTALRAQHAADREHQRTADGFDAWRDALLAQVAASWFVSCVFVRTLEDRGLLATARIAGPGATDSQRLFLELAPSLTERDYLLFVFRELAGFPASRDLFDRAHALVWRLAPSADAAKELLRLFRTPTADAPALRFGQPDTRWLGDLYQDLYDDVRKRFALLQTPDFIESFILDRTLEPAIERFGLDETTLIDPTCGSGHFLLGAFERLFDHRLRAAPGLDVREAARLAMDAIHGADINPYAVAIARFRLTLAYLDKAGIPRLADAPEPPMHLVVGDSLLHNPNAPQQSFEYQEGQSSKDWRAAPFALEDDEAARAVLCKRYAAVVGNPPYITEKDKARRDCYRQMYRSAAMQYSLAAPFCERFFQLARERGCVGQITANSFMKREFGKKLIEDFLPSVNLELIVNTSGAYIPGHGTPTVLLFGTNGSPASSEVLTVLAKRGEPSTPADPRRGEVWSSIAGHWNDLGFDNDYITVAKTDRQQLASHPWTLSGGGAQELKQLLESRASQTLGELVLSIGRVAHTGNDEAYVAPPEALLRQGLRPEQIAPFVEGEVLRDWAMAEPTACIFPYTANDLRVCEEEEKDRRLRFLWPYRTMLWERREPNGTHREIGFTWYQFSRFHPERFRGPGIAFAFVATHNHFVLDRGGKVFNRSAPIIKLPETATEDDHLALLAYLNSSTACFWMKQVFSPKGMHNGSEANATPFLVRYEFDGTKLAKIPLPSGVTNNPQLIELGRQLDAAARERQAIEIEAKENTHAGAQSVQTDFESSLARRTSILHRQIALQESIDWLVYRLFALTELDEDHAEARTEQLGARAFERALAENDTALARDWCRWHGLSNIDSSSPCPRVRSRLAEIHRVPEIAFLESPEFKRRWVQPAGKAAQSLETDDKVLRDQLNRAVIDQIEKAAREHSELFSVRELRERIATAAFAGSAHWLHGPEADLEAVIADSLRANAAAFCSVLRHSPQGMRKHLRWRQVWQLQRAEDRGESVRIAVPEKYTPKDFVDAVHFSLRGKLDVPKERFISYPGCESDEDGEPVYGWAGWDHLQRAQALASLYQKRKTDEGWTAERLTPMLAGLLELIPWVQQWHNEPDPAFGGLKMGDYFAQFLDGECQALGLTHADLEAWRPPKKQPRRKKKPSR